MFERYKRYRSYGHGRFVAMTLAPSPEWFLYAVCAVTGWYLGEWFWSMIR